MTLNIEVSPELLTRLQEKAEREGRDAEAVAAAVLAEALEWEAEERAEAIAGIRRGLADFRDGRFRPLEDVIADKRRSMAYRIDVWQYERMFVGRGEIEDRGLEHGSDGDHSY